MTAPVPAPAIPWPIDEQIACVRRELGQRARVYGRRVEAGHMTQAEADKEIDRMRAVYQTLERVRDGQRPGLL